MSAHAAETAIADVDRYIDGLGRDARAAASELAVSTTSARNRALLAMADALDESREVLIAANAIDLEAGRAAGLTDGELDRLELRSDRIDAMIGGLRDVAALADPVGVIEHLEPRPSGIRVGRMRVPLGVIAIIYESRPNVTADAAALCIKSGNVCILRGGSEALRSNRAIADCLVRGLEAAGLPSAGVQVLATADRSAVGALLKADSYIDLVIPRGGRSLIERVAAESRIPVLKHLDGICHVYIDADADREKALAIAVNAKTQRTGVCNAMETLLVDRAIADTILPPIASALAVAGVELRGCEASRGLVPDIAPATEADWSTEYLAPILSIRIVDGIEAAMAHIGQYGSQHTDAIVTENWSRAQRFLREVDSASVMVNASTRFADGAEFGLGAEIGISTDRLHARGPVGLEGLTTRKFVVLGDGQVRS